MCKKTYSEKFNMPTESVLRGVLKTVGFLNSFLDATRVPFCPSLVCINNDGEGSCSLKAIGLTYKFDYEPPTCSKFERGK